MLIRNESEFNLSFNKDTRPHDLFPIEKKVSKFIKSLRILSNRYPVNPYLKNHPLCNMKKIQTTKQIRQREIQTQLSDNQDGLLFLKNCGVTLNLQILRKIDYLQKSDESPSFPFWIEYQLQQSETKPDDIAKLRSILDDPVAYEIQKFAKTCFKLFKIGDYSLISVLMCVERENIKYFTKLGFNKMSAFFIFVRYCLDLNTFDSNNQEQMTLFNEASFVFVRNTPYELIQKTSTQRWTRQIIRFLLDYPHSAFALTLLVDKYPLLVNLPYYEDIYLFNKFIYEKENSETLPNLDILLKHMTIETVIKSVDTNKHQFSSLHMVIINGNKNVYQKILAKFPSLFFTFDKYDQSPFSFLCNKPEDWHDLFVWTLQLMESFVTTHPSYYKLFQEFLSKPNISGYNCLTLSIQAKNVKNAIRLMEKYTNLCHQIDSHHQTILGWIVFNYCESKHQDWITLIIKCLQQMSTNEIERKWGEFGQTFVSYAYGSQNFKLCDSLIDLVPHFLNIPNNKNTLPIHSLAMNGHGQSKLIQKVLQQMDHTLWYQRCTVKSSNALHLAARFLNFHATQILMDHAPELCIVPDENGFLVLYYLVQHASNTYLFPQLWKPIMSKILQLMQVHNLTQEFIIKHQQTICEIDSDNKWLIDELNKFY
jgi:hypothetical protein